MDERTIKYSRHDRRRFASDLFCGGEYKRGMLTEISVELQVGGLRIPGFIEFNAEAGRVMFTIKKIAPFGS